MELRDQIALVTGGSRGIGFGIARALAEGGARVAVVGRSEEGAVAAADGLSGEGHRGFSCDVSDPQETAELIERVSAELGPVELLVNNAGITRDQILLRLTHEDWDEVMAVNLKGAFNMTKLVARGMMRKRNGVILNISSVVGVSGNAGQSNYAASKAGLLGFTKSVARELASRNVRCNAIAPGYIDTDMTRSLDEEQTEALKSQIPLGRLGTPEDIAGVARFLAGPSARYITGQVLTVDGGMVM